MALFFRDGNDRQARDVVEPPWLALGGVEEFHHGGVEHDALVLHDGGRKPQGLHFPLGLVVDVDKGVGSTLAIGGVLAFWQINAVVRLDELFGFLPDFTSFFQV